MRRYLCFFCLILVLLSACHLKHKTGHIIAQVNQEVLTEEELKNQFTTAQWEAMSPDTKREYIRQWIDLTLMAQQAEEKKLDKKQQVIFRTALSTKKVLANALIAQELSELKVSEEELFNYYRIHQGELASQNQQLKVQRILVTDSQQEESCMNDLQKGLPFGEAAKIYSQEPAGQNGGYAGIVSAADPDPTLWNALKGLQLNEITAIKMPTGTYIIRYYATVAQGEENSFEAMKDEIKRRIIYEKRQQIYDDLLKELKTKADISISL